LPIRCLRRKNKTNPNKINMKTPMKKMVAVKKAVKEMPAPMKKAMAMKKMMAMKKSK